MKFEKKILIINGSGGVGKGELVNAMSDILENDGLDVTYYSIVDPIKDLAHEIGWDGTKSERNRKFISDLKILTDNYNDYSFLYMLDLIGDFKSNILDTTLLCIDMREPKDIERLKTFHDITTILVTRDSVPQIKSNIADASVYDMEYDYKIENNGTLKDLKDSAQQLLESIYDCKL